MTNKNTLSISNLDETTFLSILIGICGLLPGNIANPRELYNALKSDTNRIVMDTDIFFAKLIANRAAQLKGYRVDGNLVMPNNYLLLGTLWAMLNGSMRATIHSNFNASIAKRLIAISSIIQGSTDNDFNLTISQSEHKEKKLFKNIVYACVTYNVGTWGKGYIMGREP